MADGDAKDNIALVTGGAIRVGRAIVQELAAAGYRVWVHYNRSADPARELIESLGDAGLGALQANLHDQSARQQLVDAILDPSGPGAGRLHLLVNSAASFEQGPDELNALSRRQYFRLILQPVARTHVVDGHLAGCLDKHQ